MHVESSFSTEESKSSTFCSTTTTDTSSRSQKIISFLKKGGRRCISGGSSTSSLEGRLFSSSSSSSTNLVHRPFGTETIGNLLKRALSEEHLASLAAWESEEKGPHEASYYQSTDGEAESMDEVDEEEEEEDNIYKLNNTASTEKDGRSRRGGFLNLGQHFQGRRRRKSPSQPDPSPVWPVEIHLAACKATTCSEIEIPSSPLLAAAAGPVLSTSPSQFPRMICPPSPLLLPRASLATSTTSISPTSTTPLAASPAITTCSPLNGFVTSSANMICCRICLGEEDFGETQMISPCKCAGHSQFVHRACLNTWRKASNNSMSRLRCDVCKVRKEIVMV